MDDDTEQAAWDQQAQDERRQREEAAIARGWQTLNDFRASNAEFARWNDEHRQQLNTLKILL